MDFIEKVVIFLLPVLAWWFIVFNELYNKESRKAFYKKVQQTMNKILYVVAKGRKKETSASDDFMNNFDTSGITQPSKPEVKEKSAGEILSENLNRAHGQFEEEKTPIKAERQETIQAEPIKKEEVKPFSDPVPTEPKEPEPDVVVKLDITEPKSNAAIETLYFKNILNNIVTKVDLMFTELKDIKERMTDMARDLGQLTAEVARAKTVHKSTIDLIHKVVVELETVKEELKSANSNADLDVSALDSLASDLASSTDALADAVASSADVVKTHKKVINADKPDKVTVEVVLPEVLPEIVEAEVEVKADPVDVASPEPQVEIVVKEAEESVAKVVEETAPEVVADPATDLTTETGEVVSTEVLETAEGEADVAVAVKVEDKAAAEAAGVNVVEAVKEAYDETPEVKAVPLNTDHATTPETGGAATPGAEGTQSGETAEKPTE